VIGILRDERGVVSLIELLLVMAILSILVVTVLPNQEAVVDDAKVMAMVENLEMLKKGLLKFYADMGVWPANNSPDGPDPGIADVDLMGGKCGGSGSTETVAASSEDPGLLCQGTTAGVVAVMGSDGTFGTASVKQASRKWRGPYINRELKSHPFGGSYVLAFESLSTAVTPGSNAFCHSASGDTTNCQDVAINVSQVSRAKQIAIDRLLDDGNLTTGFVQGSGTTLTFAVAVF